MALLQRIENGRSVNDLVDKINEVLREWNSAIHPIAEPKSKCMKASDLDKTPGANCMHMIRGLIVAAIADCNMNCEQVKKEITFIDKKPFIKLGNF